MKTGKEVKTSIFKDYNVVFGSVNNKNPKAVYVNLSAWAEPKHESDINYSRVIRNINKKKETKQLSYLNFVKCEFFTMCQNMDDLAFGKTIISLHIPVSKGNINMPSFWLLSYCAVSVTRKYEAMPTTVDALM